MKVFFKIVALAIVGVLAAYPALAGASCAMGSAANVPCKPDCGMAMSGMGIDCPMHDQASKLGCAENCCQNSMQPGVAQLDAKPKAVRAELIAILPPATMGESRIFANLQAERRVDTGPPRFILLRVLRI
jgi:hypothetical protein